MDVNNPENRYHSGLVTKVIREMMPITMPFIPEKTIEVYVEDFLTDKKNGDFDTVGILYFYDKDHRKVYINKFFKSDGDEPWIPITPTIYNERKKNSIKRRKDND